MPTLEPRPARYDDLILGGGAAGLSLAHALSSQCPERKVLLLERAPKRGNDRTWCFWEAEPGPFEAAVGQRWDRLWLHTPHGSQQLEIAPQRYKMIRSGDFYRLVDRVLDQNPNLTRLYGTVEGLKDGPDGVRVRFEGQTSGAQTLEGQTFEGRWAYNSLWRPGRMAGGVSNLLQHFRGWVVETEQPTFDPAAATFMDFRVPQAGQTRFVYVLPLSETRALVEYTLFSSDLLSSAEYDAGLHHYLTGVLGLERYKVLEREEGIIPMTDAPFQTHPSPHVLNIGTAGGRAKPSTGYTFRRIGRQTEQIVRSLLERGTPMYPRPTFDHYRWMDSVMLRVLASGRQSGAEFFGRLFQRNPVGRVLDFLNEDSSVQDDLALMLSVNIPLFVGTGLEVSALELRRVLRQGRTVHSRA